MLNIIPFNKPYITGKEFAYIGEAIANGHLSGDGIFTKKCQEWLEKVTGCRKALLTNSCTGALEMTAILSDIKPGDEVILPSYTFVSTANAFVLRGAVPVFIDIRSDTFNIDETKIETEITDKTRAIIVVHYAGIACEMDTIMDIAGRYNLLVIEDAAHGLLCSYKGKSAGNFGHMATLSFHETKNIHSGEGGALLLNDESLIERAEIIREKGTNRNKFFRGQVDKYSWVDIGSSYLPSEISSAFLWGQIEYAEDITKKRLHIWNKYHLSLEDLEKSGKIRCPVVPSHCKHNGHMYSILLPDLQSRTFFLTRLNEKGINCVFHYIPLHISPGGLKYGRFSGQLDITQNISDRLVRLPLWIDMGDKVDYVVEQVFLAMNEIFSKSLFC